MINEVGIIKRRRAESKVNRSVDGMHRNADCVDVRWNPLPARGNDAFHFGHIASVEVEQSRHLALRSDDDTLSGRDQGAVTVQQNMSGRHDSNSNWPAQLSLILKEDLAGVFQSVSICIAEQPNVAVIAKRPTYQYSKSGPFDLWPSGLGFEYFYGFMGVSLTSAMRSRGSANVAGLGSGRQLRPWSVPGDSATWDAVKVLWENELELIRPRS